MLSASTAPIPTVVTQHVEEAAILRNIRSTLVTAPHVRLHQLRRLDDRLAAHLDGIAVAGAFGSKLCEAALETPGVGEIFAAAVRAIEDRNSQRLGKLFAVAEGLPRGQSGLISAFGWVSAPFLQGTIRELLACGEPFRRSVGLAACAMHQVDPGAALDAALSDDNVVLRARALRSAGGCGRRALLPVCLKAFADQDQGCRFWAAWSAVLLGERDAAIRTLQGFAIMPSAFRSRALQLLLKAVELPQAHELLKSLAQDPANRRVLIQGAGIAGDPYYVPWLIARMDDPELTRLAGESFSLITGLDLAYLDLDRRPPEGVELGPSENPEGEDVGMDPDESLPWPEPEKVRAWWEANKQRFQPGVRCFMGEPLSLEHCVRVLKEGFQRQRVAAALYLSLLEPGTPLFNTSAPAWRQQRWLGKLS
jgi:uncharacterized protein (TIGR02270 family)